MTEAASRLRVLHGEQEKDGRKDVSSGDTPAQAMLWTEDPSRLRKN